MPSRLLIHNITRTTRDGVEEVLPLKSGVNVLVGEQNSGKSTWLRMLDFLMFQTKSAKERFEDVLVAKYGSISAHMTVGDRILTLTKAWDSDGAKSMTLVDGERMATPDVETLFMTLLDIPILRYPQGALTSDRTWPTLGWRSLYRHIYRRQDFWGDLAPEQPDSEQQAVLLQFLGLAEALFSVDLAKLADTRREIVRAENQKDFFLQLVQQIAPGLFPDEDLQVGLTEASIETAKARLDQEVGRLVEVRSAELRRVQYQLTRGKVDLHDLLDRRATTLDARTGLKSRMDALSARIRELTDYRDTLKQEAGRLSRVDVAAKVFAPLRVTHCPACDQSVEHRPAKAGCCFLCDQTTSDDEATLTAANTRLNFERDQIAGELKEAQDLLSAANADLKERHSELTLVERDLEGIEVALRPFQAAASHIIPESVALLDQQIGAIGSRKQGLDRLYEPLRTRDAFTATIDRLRRDAAALEAKVTQHEEQVSFETASDWLSEGFNTYLNRIRSLDPRSWIKSGAVTVRVSDRRTTFQIGGRPARAQLGGTLVLYWVLAYQYALLDLMRRIGTHYPGVAILDTFPDMAVGAGLRDPLGLAMQPFEELSRREDVCPIQVILTARDFPSTESANLVQMTESWR